MNIKHNLQLLRGQVAQMPNINLDAYQCGSAFCILGTAATMPQFQAMGLSLKGFSVPGRTLVELYLRGGQISYDDSDLTVIFGEQVERGLFAAYGMGPEHSVKEFPYAVDDGDDRERVLDEEGTLIDHKTLALARLDYAISLEP